MLQPSDRIYFIDPIQPRNQLISQRGEIRIIATEVPHYRQANFVQGTIVKLDERTPITTDPYDRTWFIGEDRNWYDGAVLDNRLRGPVLGISGDLTVLGRVARTLPNGRVVIRDARRSDGRSHTINTVAVEGIVKPALWAEELFPDRGDTDEVIEAKLAQAKVRWDQRMKHAFILREGMRRNWTHLLEENDFYASHGLPRPVWDVLITGDVTVNHPTASPVQSSASSALEGMAPSVRDNITKLMNYAGTTSAQLVQTVKFPVTVVLTSRSSSTAKTLEEFIGLDRSNLVRQLRDRTGDWSLEMSGGATIHPVLTSTYTD